MPEATLIGGPMHGDVRKVQEDQYQFIPASAHCPYGAIYRKNALGQWTYRGSSWDALIDEKAYQKELNQEVKHAQKIDCDVGGSANAVELQDGEIRPSRKRGKAFA